MSDKTSDLVTMLCWIALGFAGLVIVGFICMTIYTEISKNFPQLQNTQDETQNVENINQENNGTSNENVQSTETGITSSTTSTTNTNKPGNASQIATIETHFNYMQGYKDGRFGPGDGVSRAEVATIFARLDDKFDENRNYYSSRYTDVAETSWYSNYIGYCASELIMQGYNDGTFVPNEKMKKMEFLVAVVRYAEVDYFGYTSKYSDVKGTWAEQYIGYLEAKGFVSGKTGSLLGAQDNITRAEVCNVINNVLDRKPNKSLIDATTKKTYFSDVPQSAWYYYDVVEATTYHNITDYHQ